MRLNVGDKFPIRDMDTVGGDTVTTSDPNGLVHVQFRRWVGCPICNTHVGQMIRRAGDLDQAGVREILVFHSPAADMEPLQAEVPFDLVTDPAKTFYKRVGTEWSLLYFASAKTIWAALRGIAKGKFSMKMPGGPLGLPADFLVDSLGFIRAVKYGRSAYDQWSVNEVIELASKIRLGEENQTCGTDACSIG